MKIVADANIVQLDELFGRHGCLRALDGRAITRADLADADVLLVRSVTRVDQHLLKGTPVGFVGSTTIGTDHLDTAWLDAAGIFWASAPGCNADAAAQYTLGMILLACRRLGREPRNARVGIVGRGNVGSRLQALLTAIDIPTVACDPPLADRGEPGLVSPETVLRQPIVSLHVPLTTTGPYPTSGMIGRRELATMPPKALLVNTARGAVVDGDALLAALRSGHAHAALDVWPGEPEIELPLLQAVTVATPHVAGYSEEGKLEGTRMVYREFCRQFDLSAVPVPLLPRRVQQLDVAAGIECMELLQRAVLETTGVERDDANLRAMCTAPASERIAYFDRLRRQYPPRHQFGILHAGPAGRRCATWLARLGFATGPE